MTAKKTKLIIGILLFVILMNSAIAALKTFYVEETELLTINPEAMDPDYDKVNFRYGPPLDENGQWQTGLDDAGDYEIEIIASDGISETSRKIMVIVENKNQPPKITEKKVIIKESQLLDLKSIITDPDNDALEYKFNDPFNKNGVWQTGYEDEGTFVTEFEVSDGEFIIKGRVEVEVLYTNQPPQIKESFSEEAKVEINENELFKFFVDSKDGDGEKIIHKWFFGNELISEENSGEHFFDYESEGDYNLTLIMSDGIRDVVKKWKINVKNVNRKPEINLNPISVLEGGKVSLNLPKKDADGQKVTYSFNQPLDEKGRWWPDFNSAGQHIIKISASDGEATQEGSVNITVIDVDRAPELNLPKRLYVYEGEGISWNVETVDLDSDKLSVKIEGLPDGARFDEEEMKLIWNPDYDAIKRSGGLISNLLNSLRLEHFFLRRKVIPLTVTSCGKDLCNSGKVSLIVYNVNRPPILNHLNNITVSETNLATLMAFGTDPDGDIINYYFTAPFNRKGEWQTGYEDEGTQIIFVTATDGSDSDTKPVNVNILRSNREPTLEIRKDKLVVNEGQQFLFNVGASDPDNDEITIRLDYLPPGASFADGTFLWEPGYDTVRNQSRSFRNGIIGKWSYLNKKFSKDFESVWLSFVASDGEAEVVHPVKVTVKNRNQAPTIVDFLPTEVKSVKTNEPNIFHIAATDSDGDKLTYRWSFGLGEADVLGTDTIERTFVSPGEKRVKVLVSDGSNEILKEWSINVLAEKVVDNIQQVLQEDNSFKIYVIKS